MEGFTELRGGGEPMRETGALSRVRIYKGGR